MLEQVGPCWAVTRIFKQFCEGLEQIANKLMHTGASWNMCKFNLLKTNRLLVVHYKDKIIRIMDVEIEK